MPDFPIIDTHLHLWDPKHLRYPWLEANPLLNRPYLLADYAKACGSVAVDKMVFVQCECAPVQYKVEVDWISELSDDDPRISGIVSWAPLEKGSEVSAELAKLKANPLVKGVRRIIQFEPDPAFCLQRDFVRGVQALADFDLSFDICVKGDQMFKNTIELVARCPAVNFILDHIGKPFIKEKTFEPWASYLQKMAAFPNTWCKMSGLATEADFQTWTKEEDLKPYIDHVLKSFGTSRVIFGGDWPVAIQATSYTRWVETLEWALAGASEADLRRIFYENALTFYRL
jgi:L-fuconolactonase